jgi:transposase
MRSPNCLTRNFDQLEARRFEAAKLFDQGFSKADVARIVGVSFTSARRWYDAWKSEGVEALEKTGRAGRRPRLNETQLDEIQVALAAGPMKNGFPATRWNLQRMNTLIERMTGVAFHPKHVARILHRLGIRWHDRVRRRWNPNARIIYS